MLEETEIKLRLSAQTMALLKKHPLITERLEGHWQTVTLYNQYFDTANLALDQADVALRLRRDGEQVIQTLKGRGNRVGGLFVRNEWDWYLDDYGLSLGLLDKNCWPQALAELDKTTITPIFTTNFKRTKAILNWCWKGQAVEVEMALDAGWVVTADAQDVICELELEMHEGPVDALLELVVELASEFSLFPSSTSKAERGYRLLKPASKQLVPNDTFAGKDISLDDAITFTGEILLGRIQHLIESMDIAPEIGILKNIQQQLALLRSFFACIGSRIPANDQQLFQSLLDAMATDIQTLLLSDLSAAQLTTEFESYLAKTDWGFLCLRLSKWCLLKEWQQFDGVKQTEFSDTCFSAWLKTAAGVEIKKNTDNALVHLLSRYI